MALTHTPATDLGRTLGYFHLPGVDGKYHSSSDFKKGTPAVVMFICNHCPYVQAIEERLIQLGRDLREKGIPLVGISSNDSLHYPEDSFAKMRERAIAKHYSFPYLQDETQEVAKEYGAVCTPDFFVFDRHHQLAYRGRLDDNWKQAELVTRRELFEVALSLLADGRPVDFRETPSMGCSIKWKSY